MIRHLIARFLSVFHEVRDLRKGLATARQRLERQSLRIAEHGAELAVLRANEKSLSEVSAAAEAWTKRALQSEAQAAKLEGIRKWHVNTEKSLREKLKIAQAQAAEASPEIAAEIKELKRLLHNERANANFWKARCATLSDNVARWSDQLEIAAKQVRH